MRTIKLANDAIYDVDLCTEADNVLWFRMPPPYDKSVSETAIEFDNPENTVTIMETSLEVEIEHSNFTNLFSITKNIFGTKVGLLKN